MKTKRILRSYWLNALVIVLFGWTLISFFSAGEQIVELANNPEPPWEIEIFALPSILLLLLCAVFIVLDVKMKRQEGRGVFRTLFLPTEFREDDERERMVTAKACRASYVSMMIAGPLLAAIMTFYPLIKEIIPYFPVIVIMLLLFVQITAYHISLRRNL